MESISVLDVTLRDGGCVNDFNFGQKNIEKILSAQEASGVEIIELGYLDDINGSETDRTKYINERVIRDKILQHKVSGVSYVAMMDYGKFDVRILQKRCDNGIDGIRLAFHKKDYRNIIPIAENILSKGYMLYLQPMLTLRYSDSELLDLITIINEKLSAATGFYIVDSFGEMRPNDISRLLNLVDHNLSATMALGFHGHNNIQLSYSNAMTMLQFQTDRNIIIDSSILGMGKGAGNLNTEILLEHLNIYHRKNYRIEPLLEVIDKVINQLHDEFGWGYASEYYLSSANHCSPTYASHFYNKHMLPIDQVNELLGMIDEDKKISFDRNYAESLYRKYNESKGVDDSKIIEELRAELAGKKVLLVAPGKSVYKYMDDILMKKKDCSITIGLNNLFLSDYDYVVTTRKEIFERGLAEGYKIIAPSNIAKTSSEKIKVINYRNWIDTDGEVHDSSAVIAMNILKACGIEEIYLAGFDGYSVNINENYAEPEYRFPLSEKQAEKRNEFNKQFIDKLKNSGIKISFVSPSKYDCETQKDI